MRTRAAVLRESPGNWSVEEVELDDPREGEVLVEMVATGLCHSDDHLLTGDLPPMHLPVVGGHEGAGIVRRTGPGVTGLKEGDHIITSFIPACGQCRWCASGKQNLCDNGALIALGHQLDGSYRMRTGDGQDLATFCVLGTFAEWQVYDQLSCVKIDPDLPLDAACLVACGVQTGLGSATSAGQVGPGDVVLVVGVGGVGMNAVQGASLAGADHVIAIDPVPAKQKWALGFGATESFESISAARDRVNHLTNGQGADVCILTAGLVTSQMFGEGLHAVRKGGTLVATGMSAITDNAAIPGLNSTNLASMQKRIQGALYGMKSPREAMPALLNMYRSGRLKLDELITQRYALDDINAAYQDMRDGKNIRGVITFGH
jgi:NDMA-dependent alcohol dehydrogenase